MDRDRLHELLYEALETEKGGVLVYETALRCAINEELKKEWSEYLEQTKKHVEVVSELMGKVGLDPAKETPGRKIVRLKAEALISAMTIALDGGDASAAQLVAAECVVEAETKDHMNWGLIGEASKKAEGELARALKEAYDEVEDEEDEHLYHTMGWTRELWIESLGMPAVLPPPEEEKHVESAIGAARAQAQRGRMLRGGRRSRGGSKVKH